MSSAECGFRRARRAADERAVAIADIILSHLAGFNGWKPLRLEVSLVSRGRDERRRALPISIGRARCVPSLPLSRDGGSMVASDCDRRDLQTQLKNETRRDFHSVRFLDEIRSLVYSPKQNLCECRST